MHHYSNLDPVQRAFLVAVGATCFALGLYYQFELWQLDANGLTPAGDRLPYWDFSNLWGGSLMALDGHVGYLFDVEAYRSELDRIFAVALPHQEWSYPPHILLIGVPLALLPIWLAYAIWSLGTILAFHFALRLFRLPTVVHVFVLFSPAIWSNQVFGQNGALTAALLIAGLYHTRSRPILAGALLGLLTMKPQIGLLVPFCLLAGRYYAATASAIVTTLILFLATGFLFGFDVWTLFVTKTRPMMTSILEAPYPQAYHTHAATIFVTMRSMGAALPLAYGVQLLASAVAAAAVVWVWRLASPIDHRTKVVIAGLLTPIAALYGYAYDTAPFYLAVAWFLLRDKQPSPLFYTLIWLSSFMAPAAHDLGVSAGIFAHLAFCAYLAFRYKPLPGTIRWTGRPELTAS